MDYFEDKKFEGVDFTKNPFKTGTYEGCQFLHCNFNDAILSQSQFIDCSFHHCNLSMAKVAGSVFNTVAFTHCKMLGINFENCNHTQLLFSFDHCILHYSSFFKLKLKKLPFISCSLQEVDFTGTDLTSALFDNCDLVNAKFENTILEKADFRSSFNYTIDPTINKMKKAKFSAQGLAGLLTQFDIDIE